MHLDDYSFFLFGFFPCYSLLFLEDHLLSIITLYILFLSEIQVYNNYIMHELLGSPIVSIPQVTLLLTGCRSFKSWQKNAITGFLGEQNIKIGKPADFYWFLKNIIVDSIIFPDKGWVQILSAYYNTLHNYVFIWYGMWMWVLMTKTIN